MGFWGVDIRAKAKEARQPHKPREAPIALLHREECAMCTLNHADVNSPKMKPEGSANPLIYALMESPTYEGDKRDRVLDGHEYDVLRDAVPRKIWKHIRFSSVIRTFPGFGKDEFTKYGDTLEMPKVPTPLQIECCRPSIIRDIERTKPKAIFTFGSTALRWAANETHPSNWQGRRMPVRIGTHECWLYPFVAPVDLVKMRRWEEHTHENEKAFRLYVHKACVEVAEEHEDLPAPYIHTEAIIRKDVEWITGENGAADIRKLERFVDDAVRDRVNGFDYETPKLKPYNDDARILTAAIGRKGSTLAYAISHRQNKWTDGERKKVLKITEDYLYDPGPIKVAHNLPFEMEWSAVFFGEEVLRASKWGDSLSMAFTINEMQGMLALEVLTQQYYGFNLKELSNVNRKEMDAVPLLDVLPYNGLDSKYHRNLYLDQEPILHADGMWPQYLHLLSRIPTLVLTSLQGIPIDQNVTAEFRDKFEAELKIIEDQIAADPYVQKFGKKYGHAFNEASPYDIKKFLVDIGEEPTKTDEAYLSKIKDPLIPLILRRRKITKVLSTYVKSVCDAYVDRNGEVVPRSPHLYDDNLLHPTISTTKVVTTRTSSEEPNVQNWPNRNENQVVRRQVASSAEEVIVAIDYAGIQARNVAMESKDKRLTQAFWDRYDIHTDFMDRMIDIYPKFIKEGVHTLRDDKEKGPKLMKHYRHIAKNKFVFPTFFGAASKRVALDCDVPISVGEEMQEEFFTLFPGIKEWQLDIQAFYERNGYVTGLSGFRRHAPVSWNELINSPIQADEAKIVMCAMNALSELDYKHFVQKRLPRYEQRHQAMMEIHDDLTFRLPKKGLDERLDTIIREMVKPRFDWINVPLVVEVSVGKNWAEKESVGDFENVGDDGSYVQIKGKPLKEMRV